jgi:hypothetical protein
MEREAVIYDQKKILSLIGERGRITTLDIEKLGYSNFAQSTILNDLEEKGLIKDAGYVIIEKPFSVAFNGRDIGNKKGKGCRSYCLTKKGKNLKNKDVKEVLLFKEIESPL